MERNEKKARLRLFQIIYTYINTMTFIFVNKWNWFGGQIANFSSLSQFEKGGYDSAAVVYKFVTRQYRSRVNKQQLQRQKQDQWKLEAG